MIVEPVQVIVFGAVAIVAAAKGMGAWALVVGQYAGVLMDTTLSWALVASGPGYGRSRWRCGESWPPTAATSSQDRWRCGPGSSPIR